MDTKVDPGLKSVPETMLWTLHNRASEAVRPDGILKDDEGVRIYKSIDYDYERSFRKADGVHAIRAVVFDRELKKWIESHPEGFVVGLAEGLETQCKRVDNGRIRWLSIDLPEGMEVRERFIAPTDRFKHLGMSALDESWMEKVDASNGVFITVQGLFMYLQPDDVRTIMQKIAKRFPGAVMMFDTSPTWMSEHTKKGWQKTPNYKVPHMPWGLNRNEVEPTIRQWLPNAKSIELFDFGFPRGIMKLFMKAVLLTPWIREHVPVMARVQL